MQSLSVFDLQADGRTVVELNHGFEYFSTEPGLLADSDAASAYACPRKSVTVPGALAACVTDLQSQSALDQLDHWYFATFSGAEPDAERVLLRLDGLLTFAEVYLNGHLLLKSSNAYHIHEVDVTTQLAAQNHLCMCFRAIEPVYRARHPRAAYMTRLVNERHLRLIRTPVLGYTPGFSTAAKPVGPYRPICLISLKRLHAHACKVETSLYDIQDTHRGTGRVKLALTLEVFGKLPAQATLVLQDDAGNPIAQQPASLVVLSGQIVNVTAELTTQVSPYWPHTHGSPVRYALSLSLDTGDTVSLGLHGFRSIARMPGERFMLQVNGEALFLRGACWTPIDPIRLHVDVETLRQRLSLLRDAGFNMLRIPGNMLYECDAFYALCDALGILVFQDFAFTNFEYPETPEFLESVRREVQQFLDKHGWRPSLAVLCGGSEVAQQAAMMGVPVERCSQALFTQYLPDIIREHTAAIPYAVSSPHASAGLPFHCGDGPVTYFGVGGYLRSVEDARLFKGSFITECLPFSHVPEDESLRQFWNGEIPPTHHPLWKEGVTRDPGSGWDFSDVTDHYLRRLYDLDPVRLRAVSPERYLAFCRVTVVEMVETTMAILRAYAQTGRAALVWLLHDLRPGAGWGYIDVLGQPKSAFYALARTFEPTTVLFVDEGLEGLAIYAAHDAASTLHASMEVSLLTELGEVFETYQHRLTLTPRSVSRHSVDTLAGHFVDSSYAYRFGPRAFVSCVATLRDEAGNLLARKVYTPPAETCHLVNDAGLSAHAQCMAEGIYQLTLSSHAPAYYVSLDIPGFQLSQNYFHVLPGYEQTVTATAKTSKQAIHGRVRALNVKKTSALQIA